MSTITRKSIEAQIDTLWERAKELGNTDAMEELLEIMKEFYGVKSDPKTNPETTPKQTTTNSDLIFDHHEQEMDELYGTPGGQYDPDTGVWCIPRRR